VARNPGAAGKPHNRKVVWKILRRCILDKTDRICYTKDEVIDMQEVYIGIWAAILVVALVVEAVTQGLVSVWFAAGALAAMLCAVLDVILSVQLAVFFLVSGVLLAFLLPYVRKRMEVRRTATNADRIIGAEGIVTEKIDEVSGTGQIRVMGAVWSAKAAHGIKIPEGERVEVEGISGVKAVVSQKR